MAEDHEFIFLDQIFVSMKRTTMILCRRVESVQIRLNNMN